MNLRLYSKTSLTKGKKILLGKSEVHPTTNNNESMYFEAKKKKQEHVSGFVDLMTVVKAAYSRSGLLLSRILRNNLNTT